MLAVTRQECCSPLSGETLVWSPAGYAVTVMNIYPRNPAVVRQALHLWTDTLLGHDIEHPTTRASANRCETVRKHLGYRGLAV